MNRRKARSAVPISRLPPGAEELTCGNHTWHPRFLSWGICQPHHSFIHSVADATVPPHTPLWVGWTLHGTCTASIAGSASQLIEATRNTNTAIQGSFQGRCGQVARLRCGSLQHLCPREMPCLPGSQAHRPGNPLTDHPLDSS